MEIGFRNGDKQLKKLFDELNRLAQFVNGSVYVNDNSVTLRYVSDTGDITSNAFTFSIEGYHAVEADLKVTAFNWKTRWCDCFDEWMDFAKAQDYLMEMREFYIVLKRNKEEHLYPYSPSGLACLLSTLGN